MKVLNWLTFILVVIGGINWGLIGLLNFNLVATIFGDMTIISKIIYILVGLSAIYMLITAPKMMKQQKMQPQM